MNEHTFAQSIHRRLRGKLFVWKIAAGFASGVPDAWYSGTKGDIWVEYKYGNYKPSALQLNWLISRHNEGRRCWLVIGSPKGVVVHESPPYALANTHKPTFLTVEDYCKKLLDVCADNTSWSTRNGNSN